MLFHIKAVYGGVASHKLKHKRLDIYGAVKRTTTILAYYMPTAFPFIIKTPPSTERVDFQALVSLNPSIRHFAKKLIDFESYAYVSIYF